MLALCPGDTAPSLERVVTQDIIDRYAKASGDHNPIHVDPDYAAKGPFGRTIAHGLMTLTYAAEMLNHWTDNAFDQSGGIDVAFTGPVYVGETIRLTAGVDTIDADGAAVCTLKCTSGDRQVLLGTVRLQQLTEKGD